MPRPRGHYVTFLYPRPPLYNYSPRDKTSARCGHCFISLETSRLYLNPRLKPQRNDLCSLQNYSLINTKIQIVLFSFLCASLCLVVGAHTHAFTCLCARCVCACVCQCVFLCVYLFTNHVALSLLKTRDKRFHSPTLF